MSSSLPLSPSLHLSSSLPLSKSLWPKKKNKSLVLASEKKPKAGKKLPKDAGKAAIGGEKKKRTKKNAKTYKIYIFKVIRFIIPLLSSYFY
ncbi:hypothetical protein ABFS83_05G078100 [Erythranthe nasuta]